MDPREGDVYNPITPEERRARGAVDQARENLTTNVIELFTSLQSAIIEAGGVPQVLDPKMTIGELFTILAPNKIRFHYEGAKR